MSGPDAALGQTPGRTADQRPLHCAAVGLAGTPLAKPPCMLAFIIRRLFQALVVMVSVGVIAFALFQFVGDPVNNLMGQEATAEQRAQLRADLGLDRSALVQFTRFAANALRGEFGLSLRQGRKVSSLIAERLPATLELAWVAALLALLLGIPMGVVAALKRGHPLSQALMAFSLVGV